MRSLFSAFSSKRSQIFRTRGGARRSASSLTATIYEATHSPCARRHLQACSRGRRRACGSTSTWKSRTARSCSSMPASSGLKASCRSVRTRAIAPDDHPIGSRARTRTRRRRSGKPRRTGDGEGSRPSGLGLRCHGGLINSGVIFHHCDFNSGPSLPWGLINWWVSLPQPPARLAAPQPPSARACR
jgi:hypothetical protein